MDMLSGKVAVLTRGDGTVLATAADFDPKSPGYSNTEDAQSGRARSQLANAFIREWCGDDIASVIRGYDAERLVGELCRLRGYAVTVSSCEIPSPAQGPLPLGDDHG